MADHWAIQVREPDTEPELRVQTVDRTDLLAVRAFVRSAVTERTVDDTIDPLTAAIDQLVSKQRRRSAAHGAHPSPTRLCPASLLPPGNPMLDYIEIDATAPIHGTVIWLHGLGASGDDFAPVVPMLRLPHLRFILPHAPPIPVTLNQGWVMPAWYDILTISGPGREDVGGLHRSAAAVLELVDREATRGIPSERVVIIGFSQGGAVALDLLTRADRRFAGGIILSSYLVDGPNLAARLHPANADTPVWFGHGTFDPMVPMHRGRAAHDALAALGRPVSWSEYPMAHNVDVDELRDLRAHLVRWLPER